MRIEHRQEMINKTQYGKFASHPKLNAANYKLACHPQGGRGAYTFCMCPGGTVVCASSEEGGVVVNGMSEYARDGENADSALLVGIEPELFPSSDVLSGMYMQREIERHAFKMGGSDYTAPAQKVGDFMNNLASSSLGSVKPTCPTGVRLTNLRSLLPAKVTETILEALPKMDKMLPGFASMMLFSQHPKREALLLCASSETSFSSRMCEAFIHVARVRDMQAELCLPALTVSAAPRLYCSTRVRAGKAKRKK